MSEKGLRELFGEVIVDPIFKERLYSNLEATIALDGWKIDKQEMTILKELVATRELDSFVVEDLEERVALCSASFAISANSFGMSVTMSTGDSSSSSVGPDGPSSGTSVK